MFLKKVSTIARFALLVLPVAALTTVNCGDGGNGGTAGTTGTAGATGTAGSTGTGGATGTAGTGVVSCTSVSPTAADSTIMDWENAIAGATTSAFAGYEAGTYGGGTFQYPGPASGGTCDPAMHLCPNFDGKNWHITGTVRDYAGIGIYFNMGVVWDVSMFTGLSFDVSGTFTVVADLDAGSAPAAQLTLNVTDRPHEVDSAHTIDGRLTCGTCAPSNGSEYDGTCAAPFKVIALTSTPTPTTLRWTDISGGRRPPNFTGESPNPMQITHISWVLPWNGLGSTPYTLDIVIDNLKYLTN
jgi:hypothetical protein